MGSGGFNRQAYTVRQSPNQRKSSGVLGGLLFILFIVVLGVLGFAGYKYVEANGLPDLGLEPAPQDGKIVADDISTVVAKLEEIEKRLARLESRQGGATDSSSTAERTTGTNGLAKSAASGSGSSPQSTAVSSRSRQNPGTAPNGREATYRARQYDKLAGQVSANEERWDATSDRLADTVTDLNEQRRESAEQRARLNKLWERFERVPIDFDLHKRDGKRRVGPVLLWLRKSDVKNHRYTLRVLVDDKWVEFKDRALMEPLEIYLRDVPVPVELLVSQISKDQITGTLGVPERLPER